MKTVNPAASESSCCVEQGKTADLHTQRVWLRLILYAQLMTAVMTAVLSYCGLHALYPPDWMQTIIQFPISYLIVIAPALFPTATMVAVWRFAIPAWKGLYTILISVFLAAFQVWFTLPMVR